MKRSYLNDFKKALMVRVRHWLQDSCDAYQACLTCRWPCMQKLVQERQSDDCLYFGNFEDIWWQASASFIKLAPLAAALAPTSTPYHQSSPTSWILLIWSIDRGQAKNVKLAFGAMLCLIPLGPSCNSLTWIFLSFSLHWRLGCMRTSPGLSTRLLTVVLSIETFTNSGNGKQC